MKVKIEIEMEKKRLDYFDKMAKSLNMEGGASALLKQELEDRIAEIEMWLDRQYITETLNPSSSSLPTF